MAHSIVDAIMAAGEKAGSIFGSIKDSGSGAAKGFFSGLDGMKPW